MPGRAGFSPNRKQNGRDPAPSGKITPVYSRRESAQCEELVGEPETKIVISTLLEVLYPH